MILHVTNNQKINNQLPKEILKKGARVCEGRLGLPTVYSGKDFNFKLGMVTICETTNGETKVENETTAKQNNQNERQN